MKKVLIGVPNWSNLIKTDAQKLLQENGFEIIANESGGISEHSFMEQNISDADAIIAGGLKIDADLLRKAAKLKVITRYGVGIDNIDVRQATAQGIYISTTSGANANSVAEHAVALILAVQRRIVYCHNAVRVASWEAREFPELSGKKVGLIGFGRIARLVAKLLSGFDVCLSAYDKIWDEEAAAAAGVRYAEKDAILRQSDIVSLHIPSTPQTRHFIGMHELTIMKPGAYLVNTARGTLIDEIALYTALKEGGLAGAALDVTESEPCSPQNPLLDLPNVIITPHIAGGSFENHLAAGMICARAIVDTFAGKTPENSINIMS